MIEYGPGLYGIGPAARTVGKQGAHALSLFSRVITVNLIGSFNMIRLAADAMAKNEPEATGERGCLIATASVAAPRAASWRFVPASSRRARRC